MGKLKDQIIMYKPEGKGPGIDFDIVPLVRCRNCRWYSYDKELHNWECTHRKGLMDCEADTWCSYGEEKAN